MKTSSLVSWFILSTTAVACGPEAPEGFEPSPSDTTTANGGSGPIVASSDGASAGGASAASTGSSPVAVGNTGAPQSSAGSVTTGFPGSSSSAGVGGTTSGSTGVAGVSSVTSATGADPSVTSTSGGSGGSSGPSSTGSTGSDLASAGAAGQTVTATATTGVVDPPSIDIGSLLLTEYIESGSDKAIEVSNVSGAPIRIDGCEFLLYFNGNSVAGGRIALAGELAPGSSYVVGYTKSAPELQALCQLVSGSLSFNGNDAVVLECNAVVLDSIGQVGEPTVPDSWQSGEPGTPGYTSTADQILRRNCGAPPRVDILSPFDPGVEWLNVGPTLGAERDLSDLGRLSCDAGL